MISRLNNRNKSQSLNNQTKQIASTTARLLGHTDRIAEIKQTHKIRPITIHLAPTNKCNLQCEWCSVRNRDKQQELAIGEIQAILDLYGELGIKSVEITGGGEPTLHPHINDIIQLALERDLDVGLITNGLLLERVNPELLQALSWLRISLSAIDFDLDERFLDVGSLKDSFPTYVGCSYVFTRKSMFAHRLARVNNIATLLNADYIRIVPDCYTPTSIEWTREVAKNYLHLYPKMFLQIKPYYVPHKCYWRYIKPFVNADGYVYHCSTCALFDGHFSERWRVCHWQDIPNIYFATPSSFDTSSCTLCFYPQQNELLDELLIAVQNPRFL